MNTTAQALAFAVAVTSVAAAAAIGTGLAERSHQPAPAIVKLERVVIVGKRTELPQAPVVIAQLPRVLIEGRRTVPADEVQLADAKPVAAKAI
ncbi:MAG: hypothetical protein ABW005_11550 [Burkholderiaceae bacterium]